jgi:hypothetical protein
LLVFNRLYLLGDVTSSQGHLVAEAFRDMPQQGGLRTIDAGRSVAGTGYKLAVYEISRFIDPSQLHSVKVAGLS